MLNTKKLGLIFRPRTTEQEHILTLLSHAMPCITIGDMHSFFSEEEAEIYREQAIDEGIEFIGYFDPAMA